MAGQSSCSGVPGGETRPYKAKVSLAKARPEWVYCIRKHSSTVRARGQDERELLSLAATVPFDDRYRQTASLDDLSHRLIQEFLRDIGSDLAPQAADLSIAALGQTPEHCRWASRSDVSEECRAAVLQ